MGSEKQWTSDSREIKAFWKAILALQVAYFFTSETSEKVCNE